MVIFSRLSVCIGQLIIWSHFCPWSRMHLSLKKTKNKPSGSRIRVIVLRCCIHRTVSWWVIIESVAELENDFMTWPHRFRINRERNSSMVSVGRQSTCLSATAYSEIWLVAGFLTPFKQKSFLADTYTDAVNIDQSTAGVAKLCLSAISFYCHWFKPWDGTYSPVSGGTDDRTAGCCCCCDGLFDLAAAAASNSHASRLVSATRAALPVGARTCHRVLLELVDRQWLPAWIPIDCRSAVMTTAR